MGFPSNSFSSTWPSGGIREFLTSRITFATWKSNEDIALESGKEFVGLNGERHPLRMRNLLPRWRSRSRLQRDSDCAGFISDYFQRKLAHFRPTGGGLCALLRAAELVSLHGYGFTHFAVTDESNSAKIHNHMASPGAFTPDSTDFNGKTYSDHQNYTPSRQIRPIHQAQGGVAHPLHTKANRMASRRSTLPFLGTIPQSRNISSTERN